MNRSAPHARVTPVLTVADVRAAVAWYAEVFGFVEHVRIGEAHRSQLGLPDGQAAEVVVAEVRPGRRTPQGGRSHQVMLKVEDVASVVEAAVARGAMLVDPQHDWEYGERQAAIDDPFGHQWVLNQTLIDVAPEEWGGLSVTPRPAARQPGSRVAAQLSTPPAALEREHARGRTVRENRDHDNGGGHEPVEPHGPPNAAADELVDWLESRFGLVPTPSRNGATAERVEVRAACGTGSTAQSNVSGGDPHGFPVPDGTAEARPASRLVFADEPRCSRQH